MQNMLLQFWTNAILKIVALLMVITAVYMESRSALADDEPEMTISGSIVDMDGKPAEGAVVALCRHSQDIASGKQTTAGAEGHFSITTSVGLKIVETMHLESKLADGSQIGFLALRSYEEKIDLTAIELQLDAVKKARMLVIDADEKPIEGARVCVRLGEILGRTLSAKTDKSGIAELTYSDSEPVAVAFAWKEGAGLDYHLYQPAQQGFGATFSMEKPERFKLDGATSLKLKYVDENDRPLQGIKVNPLILRKSMGANLRTNDLNLSFFSRFTQEQTDANGEVSFGWLPSWQKGLLSFSSSGGEELVHTPANIDPSKSREMQTVQLYKTVPIRGQVVDVDGKPVKGITVSVTGEGSTGTTRGNTSQTDEAGKYEVRVAPNQICLVIVKDRQWASTPQQGFAVYPNTPVEGKDFKLRKATRIYGKVRSGFWLAEVPKHRVVISQLGKSLGELPDVVLPEPLPPRKLSPNSRPSDTFEAWTDEKGNFELFVGDGEFVRISDGQGKEFKIAGEESYEMNIEAARPRALTDATGPLLGLIVDEKNNQPARDSSVTVVPRAMAPQTETSRPAWEATTDAEGKFRAERIRVGSFIHAISSDKKLAAIMEIKQTKNVFVMKLRPVGTAFGRLLTADGTKPIANQKFGAFYIVPYQRKDPQRKDAMGRGETPWGTPSFVVDCTTDSEGRFRFEQVVPNVEYQVYQGPSIDIRNPLFSFTVDEGEELDLGDLKMP